MSRLLKLLMPILLTAGLLAGCQYLPGLRDQIAVELTADGLTRAVRLPAGGTVNDAIQAAGLTLGPMDRTEPEPFAQLQDGDAVRLIRVREEFRTEREVLPFDQQTVHNESLPEDRVWIVQQGVNGEKEVTYRTVYEDGVPIIDISVKTVILTPPIPEIMMISVPTVFAPVAIPGRLVYLDQAGGNAWVMEGSTAERRPLVTTGDLDGRIFSLSPDGDWLLFTRRSNVPEQQINTLWAVSVDQPNAKLINLKAANIVHYAGWIPNDEGGVMYSTVEPRRTAPGWQANNDLWSIHFFSSGETTAPRRVVDVNSGGIYGWWGMNFAWSPDGSALLYARPDGIGQVNIETGALTPLVEITPLQTREEWAWVPGMAWGADSLAVYWVNHAAPPSMVSAEESPNFDLAALSLANPATVPLIEGSGMFAYPAVSPPLETQGERGYLIAYLQAMTPQQSQTSGYRLVVMDRDGSNRRTLFPAEGKIGMEPSIAPVWAPAPLENQAGLLLAVLYENNLFLINSADGSAQQVTGDGQIKRIDWK